MLAGYLNSTYLAPYQDKHLTIDYNRAEVFLDGIEVSLTRKEFNLLALMVQNQGEIVPRDLLLFRVWGTFAGFARSSRPSATPTLRRSSASVTASRNTASRNRSTPTSRLRSICRSDSRPRQAPTGRGCHPVAAPRFSFSYASPLQERSACGRLHEWSLPTADRLRFGSSALRRRRSRHR